MKYRVKTESCIELGKRPDEIGEYSTPLYKGQVIDIDMDSLEPVKEPQEIEELDREYDYDDQRNKMNEIIEVVNRLLKEKK